MSEFLGYEILAKIYESANSLVYRASRKQDNQAVIIKILKEDYPSPLELTRYKQEYEITRNLKIDGVIKAYNIQPYQRTLAIILEDFGALSLKQLLDKNTRTIDEFSLPQFLKIAIETTEILEQIHSNNIIHKDINPANIVFNPETEKLKIIDFGISTRLTCENHTLKNPNVLEGTLGYISPEQTGRMNRILDYRTDFYSLGVTFYELLTGKLPFETTDALELVHCHIAKQPVPPHELVGAQQRGPIPQGISNIVMKLMAKTAEERYQSAWGIKADLEECLHQLQTKGEISDFLLATQDISARFQIPQKLYGRDREVETLLKAFDRVANPPQSQERVEMMLVAGYSGIGKSSLVAEVHKPITEKRGYFISGKFDQFQRNIPYSALVSAFKELMAQLLTESEAQLSQWREKLLAAVGNNGQVIIDVIPEVELIVGKQLPVPELGSTESQNRFNLVFSQFIGAFCTKEHPLVIFLDDLQWADSATLKLIELMMTDNETQYLFLIGAYRDNEVSSTHLLMMMLEGLQKQGAIINSITLAPLALESISQLIADTLHSDTDSVKPLAKLVRQKTGSNPFFANQFLKTLYSENLIAFHRTFTKAASKKGLWQWDIAEIEKRELTDNVLELMIGKVKKLPEFTQQVLQLAACIGAVFDLNTLFIISGKSRAEIFKTLTPAIQSGLILPISELDRDLLIQEYKFLHDRVQQAAYALIDEAQKQAVHLQIGRLLWQNTAPETLSEKIFEIVDRLNVGVDLVTSPQEREEIANFNLRAGKKAKAATAYTVAIDYLHIGLKLLNPDSWQSQYDLTLNLHSEAVEAAYLNGNFDEMDRLALVVQNEAQTALDKVKVFDSKIQAAVSQGKLKEAIKIGLQVLEQLGVSLPENPSQLDIQRGLEETASFLGGREIEQLINLPEMREPEPLAATYILSSIAAAAYMATPGLMVLIICELVNLSLQYGNTTWSAYGYAGYGINLCAIVKDIESAYKFGKLALNLQERLNAQNVKSKVFEIFGAHLMHWKDHFRETLPFVIQGYQSGIETGDFEFAGYCASYICNHSYFIGDELTELEQQIATYSHAVTQIRRDISFNWNVIFWQAVLNLLGRSENPIRLIGDAYNEERSLPSALETNDRSRLHFFYLNKSILCYLFGEKQQAVKNALAAEQYLDGVRTMIVESPFKFYDSLAHLALFAELSNSDRAALLDRVDKNQEQMYAWAHHAPMNHLHKFYLVEAEKARVLGQILEAEEFYEKAIAGAIENKFIQEEALAYELAAKFYLERGRQKFAQTYMKEARYAYTRWGAKAKVEHLEAGYPQLLLKSSVTNDITSNFTTATIHSTSDKKSGFELDLATVMKASQAISGEIMLDKLLANLMKILIENTGAQTGFLILDKAGEWVIEASGNVDSDRVSVLQSLAIEGQLPSSLVNYVARTQETVVKKNAAEGGRFTNDPYITTNQIKSILCAPLINQSQLSGIVYLENNLTTGAFTSDRLEIIKLLSGQVAIAISNAKLYTEVKQSEQRLKQFLDAIPIGISVHKKTGQLQYANRTAQQLLGINIVPDTKTEEIAEAYQVYRAGTQDLYPNEELPIVRALAGETAKADDLELYHPDRIVPLEVSSTPIFDETGKLVYGIAVFQDITERNQSKQLLIDYNQALETQLALSSENTQLYEASKRFVPYQFLSFLEKNSIIDVELGDRVEREMTVLFCDIRDFTTISEQMIPAENFAFINEYLGFMEPQIQKYDGFIDKYIGDAIMALFPNCADDAVKGAIAMLEELKIYNSARLEKELAPLRIGIGLHTGSLILGTVGGLGRMDGTVIGDAVNLSSRVEGLTKTYGVSLLITHQTLARLNNPWEYDFRFIEQVKAKGKAKAVGLFEVFSADPPDLRDAKIASKEKFEKAVLLHHQKSFAEAALLFGQCVEFCEGDRAARVYLERCRLTINH